MKGSHDRSDASICAGLDCDTIVHKAQVTVRGREKNLAGVFDSGKETAKRFYSQ